MADIHTKPEKLVVFAHGKESGPWGTKITRLAETAKLRGFEVISPDYSHSPDPRARVRQLLNLAPSASSALVLVGSSMGAWVSAMASAALKSQALFLLAPAFYFPAYDEEPPAPPAINAVVHGWRDEVVPVERALRYAQQHRAVLHLLDSDHGLNDRLPELSAIFDALLVKAAALGAYRQAHYDVELPGRPLQLRVDQFDPEADARLSAEAGIQTNWALVTAFNPLGVSLSANENLVRAERLRQRLEADAVRHLPASGSDPAENWPAEASLLLCDPSPGYAESIGRAFSQNAILRGRLGSAPELLWLR